GVSMKIRSPRWREEVAVFVARCRARHLPTRRLSDGFAAPSLTDELVESPTNRPFRDAGSDAGSVVATSGMHHATHQPIASLPRDVPFDADDVAKIPRNVRRCLLEALLF
ncbi:MAG TPA: hypothetical protein VIK30_16490, partial [Polyangia bacterium]